MGSASVLTVAFLTSLAVILTEGMPLGAQSHATASQPISILEQGAEGPVHRLAPSFKSERRARLVSLGATVGSFSAGRAMWSSDGAAGNVGLVLMVSSILVAPGAGSIYSDDRRRAGSGVLLRSSCLVGAFLVALADDRDNPIALAALLAIPVSMLHDITIASARSARDHNRRRADPPSVSVAPWFGDDAGGLGAQVAVRW